MKFTPLKSINVLGQSYTVTFEDLKESQIAGFCNWKEKKIVLCTSVKKNHEDYVTTLIHEVIHALFEESGMHQTSINSDIEEIICEQVSRVLFANIKLFKVTK